LLPPPPPQALLLLLPPLGWQTHAYQGAWVHLPVHKLSSTLCVPMLSLFALLSLPFFFVAAAAA